MHCNYRGVQRVSLWWWVSPPRERIPNKILNSSIGEQVNLTSTAGALQQECLMPQSISRLLYGTTMHIRWESIGVMGMNR